MDQTHSPHPADWTDEQLLAVRQTEWEAFSRNGARGAQEADYIDLLDAEIARRGLTE